MHSYSNQFGGNEGKSKESKENKIVLSLDAWTNFRKKSFYQKLSKISPFPRGKNTPHSVLSKHFTK